MASQHALYGFQVEQLSSLETTRMQGTSWHAGLGCPELTNLSALRLRHWTFTGTVSEGCLIVAKEVGEELGWAFGEVFKLRYPIQRMVPICCYAGSDDAAMTDNNSSAFNCRPKTGTTSDLSVHSFGLALDLNPVQNPYETRGGLVLPEVGLPYARWNRKPLSSHPAMLDQDSPVVAVFEGLGWSWGGRWERLKDWQHFQKDSA